MIRGQWFAVGCDLDGAPEMSRLRARLGPEGDVYFYRLLSWVMRYRQVGGRVLEGDWSVVAEFVRWSLTPGELREHLEVSGLVDAMGRVWSWELFNGWILAKYERDRKRHRQKVKAGKMSAAARQRRRRK